MRHILLTNDFPPKVGGIQSYLWELWRRLPPGSATVVTRAFGSGGPGGASHAFDQAAASSGLEVIRLPARMLLPTARLSDRIVSLAAERGAGLVVIDPVLPLGLIGASLGLPYALVAHGAEAAIPARLQPARSVLRRVLEGAALVVSSGEYVAGELARAGGAGEAKRAVSVPPGVDSARFRPATPAERAQERRSLGIPATTPVVLSVSRLVPRKGMDVLISAAAQLRDDHRDLLLVIAGTGRDRRRLERLAASEQAPVRFLGEVAEASLPALYASADVFAMLCRDRWFGLEQEGFGIVFLEAASSGLPAVAGSSGGSAEAVADGISGHVVRRPRDASAVAGHLRRLIDDPSLRARMGEAGRQRAIASYSYDVLSGRLCHALSEAAKRA